MLSPVVKHKINQKQGSLAFESRGELSLMDLLEVTFPLEGMQGN